VRAPTLVVAGGRDPATPPEHGERIAGAIPGARMLVVEDGAHLVTVQRPKVVAEPVVEHLTR
jgi:pimeloyl-ACP methyl ester carboxylesterase